MYVRTKIVNSYMDWNQLKTASVVVSMVVVLANLDCHVDFNVFVLTFRQPKKHWVISLYLHMYSM